MRTHMCMHAHLYVNLCMHAHTRPHLYMDAHTNTFTVSIPTHINAYKCAHTCACMRACTPICACMHKRAHICACIHTCLHIYACFLSFLSVLLSPCVCMHVSLCAIFSNFDFTQATIHIRRMLFALAEKCFRCAGMRFDVFGCYRDELILFG